MVDEIRISPLLNFATIWKFPFPARPGIIRDASWYVRSKMLIKKIADIDAHEKSKLTIATSIK